MKRPEYFGTRGCLLQLSRSRNDNRKMRQLRDMIMMVYESSSKRFDENIQYLRKSIEEAKKGRKIDNFEAMWLNRLLASEEINWILDDMNYQSGSQDAAHVYKQSA